MSQQRTAYLYAISAVIIWSTVATAFKLTLEYLEPLNLLLYASAVATLILLVIVVLQGKIHLLKELKGRDCLRYLLLGCLNPFLYYVVLFRAYALLPAQQAQSLNYTWPITLTILSMALLKQRIGIRSLLAIGMGFCGVLVIATGGDLRHLKFTNLEGVLLAVGSSIIWAFYWIYNLKDERDAVVKLFLNFSFGLVFILIANLVFIGIKAPPLAGFLGAIYVGLFEMGITFVLWLTALKLSSTTARVSIFIYLAPFLSLIFINNILGEPIHASTIIGLVFIVLGIIIQERVGQPSVGG